jgi:hypothetical protein
VASVATRPGELPRNRIELYRVAITHLLENKWRDGVGRPSEIDVDAARLALQELSVLLQESESVKWPKAEIVKLLKQVSVGPALANNFPWKSPPHSWPMCRACSAPRWAY